MVTLALLLAGHAPGLSRAAAVSIWSDRGQRRHGAMSFRLAVAPPGSEVG
jgi:hypothetical protein